MPSRKISTFLKSTLCILLILILLEVTCQLAYRLKTKQWLFDSRGRTYGTMFERHPYLPAVPTPKASLKTPEGLVFTHNSIGLRGGDISYEKSPGITRIITFGGSSTYCNLVSDNDAWPVQLGKYLGDGYEVINFGVPGYTTVEHLIQTAFYLPDLSPDICVYYEGWNDMRNMHIKDLKPDYSDFHGRTIGENLELTALKIGNRSGIVKFANKFLTAVFIRHPEGRYSVETTALKWTPVAEDRPLRIYERNLRHIIALCRAQNIRIIMVPQIANFEILKLDEAWRWMPYLKVRDYEAMVTSYNAVLEKVCKEEDVEFLADILNKDVSKTWFFDDVHFTPAGNRRFAETVSHYIKQHPLPS